MLICEEAGPQAKVAKHDQPSQRPDQEYSRICCQWSHYFEEVTVL